MSSVQIHPGPGAKMVRPHKPWGIYPCDVCLVMQCLKPNPIGHLLLMNLKSLSNWNYNWSQTAKLCIRLAWHGHIDAYLLSRPPSPSSSSYSVTKTKTKTKTKTRSPSLPRLHPHPTQYLPLRIAFALLQITDNMVLRHWWSKTGRIETRLMC